MKAVTRTLSWRPVFSSTRVLLVAACLVQAGCGEPGRDAPTHTVTDSVGVTISTATAPAWAPGEAWSLEAVPLLEVGEASGPSEELFSSVVGASRRPDGSLVVCDRGSLTLRYFEPDGTPVRTVGGRGDGPGELRNMIDCFQRGAETWVYQAPVFPLQVFDADGAYLRSVAPPRPGGRLAVVLGVLSDGSVVARQDEGRAELPSGETALPTTVVRGHGEGALDTLGTFPSARWVRGSIVSFPGAFTPTLQVVAAGTSTYISWPERFDVLRVDSDGRRARMRLSVEPLDVELRHRLAFEERVLEGPMPTGDLSYDAAPIRRDVVATMEYPDRFPVHYGMLVSADGHLWLERGDGPRDPLPQVALPHAEPTTWDVVTSDGRWLGPVTMPALFEPLEIGADYVVGVQRDALGVERVRVHAIRKPALGRP